MAEPNNVEVREQLATNQNVAGVVYDNLEQPDKAEASYQAAQRHFRQLAEQQPSEAEHRLGIARAQNNLANLLRDMGRYDEAGPLYVEALEIVRTKLGPDHPNTKKVEANYPAFVKKRDGGASE